MDRSIGDSELFVGLVRIYVMVSSFFDEIAKGIGFADSLDWFLAGA
jgi:hypothetical protein